MKRLSNLYNSKYAVWTLVVCVVAGLLLYAIFINQAVMHVAERQELEAQVRSLSTATSEMEFRLIAVTRKIDLSSAVARGFNEAQEPHYVVRGSAGAVALRRTGE